MVETAKSRVVTCPSCSAQNRVSESQTGKLPVCGRCHKPLPTTSARPVTVTDANFSAVVGSASLPVLLDLWAAWCGPCRLVAPVIEELATELSGRVLVGKLDVDANPQIASRFRVQNIPTLLVLKNGLEVDRLVGAQPKGKILQRLQQHIAK